MNETQKKRDVLYVIGNICINLFGGGTACNANVLLYRYGPQQCATTSERRRAIASSLGFVLKFLTASSHHDKRLWSSFGCRPWLTLK